MYNSTDAFSQVAFKDVPQSYPLATSINCCYTLAAHFQPSPRDWVGIFKVGWSTIKDYHTFMWVESCGDSNQEQSSTRHAYFKEYYLPKDELDFYQFCYVNSSGQVCGASTPFCFKSQHPNDEQSAANGSDNDLMVITTQEEVDQSDREIAALKDEANRIRQQNEELETALREERREAAILKDKYDELASELYLTKQQHDHLLSTWQEQQEEIQRLKVELQEQNLAECTESDHKGDDGGLLLQIELQLREAQAMIANKDVVIEEKNNLMAMMKRHNQELAQENQKLTDDMEELRKTLDDLQKPVTARSVQPEATEMCDISDDTPVVSIVDNDEQDQPTLMCRYCLESFPGSTRAEVEYHERNHQVCPFCTLICDNMEQNVFEDHVYSHEM
ncbi:calcium-binding and coiled-coil domain-containing protein 2 isoform X2 [Syngnathus scovelli]|uniref:calcium-binding and coiled-coil domain-containing protein 2 isoform X2 n=1 Tax=Syngnathus scovelli TaxID=161590 RepID=UPI0035CA5268